jgi:hypothetical protein
MNIHVKAKTSTCTISDFAAEQISLVRMGNSGQSPVRLKSQPRVKKAPVVQKIIA